MTDEPFSITTRNGDGGKTRLYSGEEVYKDAPEPETCGDLDELVSVLGLARLHAAHEETRDVLKKLQRALFTVAAEIATSPPHVAQLKQRVDEAMRSELDRACADLEARIKMPRGFILPSGTPGAGFLDLARTVARRAERRIIGLARAGRIENPDLLAWMNRLSDYLWLLARHEEGGRTEMKENDE